MTAPTPNSTPAPAPGADGGEKPTPNAVDLATARLKSAGLRITQPRLAILRELSRQHRPASIESLHVALGSDHCDLVTVYRCMAAFEEIGVVRRSFFHNGTALYELNIGQPARYHVICRASNRVETLDDDVAEDLRRAVEAAQQKLRARGYAELVHVVEFFGIAPATSPGPG